MVPGGAHRYIYYMVSNVARGRRKRRLLTVGHDAKAFRRKNLGDILN